MPGIAGKNLKIVFPLNLGKKLNANIVKIICRDDCSGEY